MDLNPNNKISKWYFGGTASGMAVCVTHPLDLLKVHLQTQQEKKTSIVKLTNNIINKQGFIGLYNGLSASLMRQLTYSMTRFAIYDILKQKMSAQGGDTGFFAKILMGAAGGAAGGFVGTPADMINVRMQNDSKLPENKQRKYKHVFDGMWRVYTEEGLTKLFSGCTIATFRSIFITIGQLSCYDQIKIMLVDSGYFTDNPNTHFLASLSAGVIATTLGQPLDVIKTRIMSAKPGEFQSIMQLVLHTAQLGPAGFFKGYVPALLRIGPHTILTFLILEQLRINFGYYPVPLVT